MAQSVEVISHWHQSVDGLSTSTLEYYAAVEKALREKEVAGLQIERVMANEAGILSAKREYLRVRYGRLMFDICGAPFGKDFFFSWWLLKRVPHFALRYGCVAMIVVPIVLLVFVAKLGLIMGFIATAVTLVVVVLVLQGVYADDWSSIEDAIMAIPVIGVVYAKLVRPTTYYSEDTRIMFEDTVHRVVVQVVAGILTLNQLPEIAPEKLKPQSKSALG